MTRVADLTGAQLDYWVARAEGIPAEQLTIRRVQRSTDTHCIKGQLVGRLYLPRWEVLNYSTDWVQGGPLIEKYRVRHLGELSRLEWNVYFGAQFKVVGNHTVKKHSGARGDGATPLQAICRAVVRAAFGDEVEEVVVCQS